MYNCYFLNIFYYFLFSALDPGYVISFDGARNFFLCKKPIEAIEEKVEEKAISRSVAAGKKGYLLSWKSGVKGVNKILSFRIWFSGIINLGVW